jgi:hypothetical protein
MITNKKGRQNIEQSLRARKVKLDTATYEEAEFSTIDVDKLIQKQLDIIEKQSQQINKLLSMISLNSANCVANDKNNTIDVGEPESLFLDDFINTDGIEAGGCLSENKVIGESIDSKLEKLRSLKKE